MAMTKNVLRTVRGGNSYAYPVKAGALIFIGAIVAVTAAGKLAPVGNADAVAIVGIAETYCDNRNGADGAESVNALRGVFGFPIGALTFADIGKTLYAAADDSPATAGTLVLGVLEGISDDQAWVRI